MRLRTTSTLFALGFVIGAVQLTSANPPESPKYQGEVTAFLNSKPYKADKVKLTEDDLKISSDVDQSLTMLGISVYTLLRNEPFARHGYIFKDPVLKGIYSEVGWYKPDPNFRLNQLSPLESKNVEFIKSIETTYDYKVIAESLENISDVSSSNYYKDNEDTGLFGHEALMSLNHVRINPSRLLRNVIFARFGLEFKDPLLKEIFSRTSWYQPVTADFAQISAKMTKRDFIDVELLKKKEWLEILNAVNFTLPADVIAIPTVGFNALFIRQLSHEGQAYYYCSQFVHPVLEISSTIFDNHGTDVEKLVANPVIDQIRAETNAAKKLILFFNNKRYQGYVDSQVFNHSDMEIPSYLKEAVAAYGVDYRILLRKEIHARLGARFIDKKTGAIFAHCDWYKARYDLTPQTVSRFPTGVKPSREELINFSLLEGEDLGPKALKYKDKNMVVDLNGGTHFVKVGKVALPDGSKAELATDFPSIQAYESGNLQDSINHVFEKYNFNAEEYLNSEDIYAVQGC